MPLNSTDFNQILDMAPSGHVQTIYNIIKDTSLSQEHQNHNQLQQECWKCHLSLSKFLIHSNSSDSITFLPKQHVMLQTPHFATTDKTKTKLG